MCEALYYLLLFVPFDVPSPLLSLPLWDPFAVCRSGEWPPLTHPIMHVTRRCAPPQPGSDVRRPDSRAGDRGDVSLYECLDLFTQEEELGAEDPWCVSLCSNWS